MLILKEKCVKHICFIVFISIQIIGLNTVQGLQCVQCGNKTSCKDDLSDTPAECTGKTYNKCFTKIVNGEIKRGCLDPEEVTCTAENNCIATDDMGNNQLICKSCLGTDTNCSQTDAADNKYNKICEAGSTKCIKKISEKLVVRGCANEADVSQCTDKNTCELCDGVNCNKGIFPANRLNCYQCSGDKCNDVTANTLTSKPCLLLEDKDECYTKGESDSKMARGCKSDTKDNQCSTTAEGCAFCNVNDCNKMKYKEKSTLKCYECVGDSKNGDCFKNQTETTLKACQQDVLYNTTQYCYVHNNGENVKRGCLNDNSELTADKCNDAEGGACSKCSSDGCNGNNTEFTCIVCRSDEQAQCRNEADKLPGTKCVHDNNTLLDGCFHGVWHDVAIRGCMLDATLQNQELCKDKNNPNNCEICHTKNCNTKKSSAGKNSLSLAMLSFVLISLWKF